MYFSTDTFSPDPQKTSVRYRPYLIGVWEWLGTDIDNYLSKKVGRAFLRFRNFVTLNGQKEKGYKSLYFNLDRRSAILDTSHQLPYKVTFQWRSVVPPAINLLQDIQRPRSYGLNKTRLNFPTPGFIRG